MEDTKCFQRASSIGQQFILTNQAKQVNRYNCHEKINDAFSEQSTKRTLSANCVQCTLCNMLQKMQLHSFFAKNNKKTELVRKPKSSKKNCNLQEKVYTDTANAMKKMLLTMS